MHPNRGPFQSEAAARSEIVSRLAAELQPEAIWLFGSRAKGDHRADSDFDLLVIAQTALEMGGRDHDRAYAPIAGLGVGADVVPCSLGDFEQAISDRTGLIAEIIRTGRVVYSRPKIARHESSRSITISRFEHCRVPEADWDAVKSFCQNFAELLAKTEPHRFVANMSKARRKGRMFIDYLRNGQGSTAVCPWSTRAGAGGTVAVPVTWEELDGLDRANGFDIFAAAERAQGPDAWERYFEVDQVLTQRIQDVVRLQ